MMNEFIGKKMSIEDLAEAFAENGYDATLKDVIEAAERGYIYTTLEGYEDPDCLDIEKTEDGSVIASWC